MIDVKDNIQDSYKQEKVKGRGRERRERIQWKENIKSQFKGYKIAITHEITPITPMW